MKKHILTAAVAIALLPAFAHAQFYAGASAGTSKTSIDKDKISDPFLDLGFDSAHTSSDSSDFGFRAFGGYQFVPYFAVEAAYFDLGTHAFRTDVEPTGSLLGRPDTEGFELDAVGRLPLGERFSLYGRVGAFNARTTTHYSGTGSVEVLASGSRFHKNVTKATYAAGGGYDITAHISARLEWARYSDLGDEFSGGRTDADLYTVGLVYRF